MEGSNILFGPIEYVVLFVMLAASALIGVYFGCYKGQNTVFEYMLGGKKMTAFPILMSIIASFCSGIVLIGGPSEVYVYGTQASATVIGAAFVAVVFKTMFLPFIFELKCSSYFEYLEIRFNHTLRLMGSVMYIISLILYVPVVIYVPSLAFNQVSGMSMTTIAPILCAVCIFYTSLGGLNAVVWTDALQNLFTFAAVIAVTVLGLIGVGGIGNVYDASLKGERLEFFNFDFNPFMRNTFPTTFVGAIVFWLGNFAGNPASYQRFSSLPSNSHANKVVIWTTVGIIFMQLIVTLIGLIMYTKYHGCDPIVTKEVQRSGQLVPYYVIDVAKNYPGLSGLFVSGVVSASLSTMSTFFNTAALSIYDDLVKPNLTRNISDRTANLVMKMITIVLGIVATSMVFIVDKLGPILQVAVTLHGVTNGISLYMFSLGIFVPWANAKGAIVGTAAAIISTAWIAIGAQLAIIRGDLRFPGKTTSIYDCPINSTLHLHLNSTTFGYPGYGTIVDAAEDLPKIYQISYFYYSFIGFFIGMVVAISVSFLTGRQDISKLDSKLIAPSLRFLLETKKRPEYSMAPTGD